MKSKSYKYGEKKHVMIKNSKTICTCSLENHTMKIVNTKPIIMKS
jgi:hypothetical protein